MMVLPEKREIVIIDFFLAADNHNDSPPQVTGFSWDLERRLLLRIVARSTPFIFGSHQAEKWLECKTVGKILAAYVVRQIYTWPATCFL